MKHLGNSSKKNDDFRSFAADELTSLLNRLTSRHTQELAAVRAANDAFYLPDASQSPSDVGNGNSRRSSPECRTRFSTKDWLDVSDVNLQSPSMSINVDQHRDSSLNEQTRDSKIQVLMSPRTVGALGDVGPEVVLTQSKEVESGGGTNGNTRKKPLVLDIDDSFDLVGESGRLDSQDSLSVVHGNTEKTWKTRSSGDSQFGARSSVVTNQTNSSWSPARRIEGKKIRLRVNIISGFGLRDADLMVGTGVSDPYCICRIRGKKHTEFRTHTIHDNLNPVWNHQNIIADFDPGDDLEFIVMDKDNFKDDDILGEAVLQAEEFQKKGFSGLLRLDRGGSIRVKIVLELNDHGHIKALLKKSQEMWQPLESFPPSPTNDTHSVASSQHHAANEFSLGFHRLHKLGDDIIAGNFLHKCAFKPSSASRVVWDMCGLLLVIWDFAIIPYSFAFDMEVTTGVLIMIVLTASFWTLDMLKTFCTGLEHHGVLEARLQVIACHYLKTWFVFDFLLVAFDWSYVILIVLELSEEASAGKSFRLFKSARSVRTVRSLSMVRLWKLGSSLGSLISHIRKPVLAAVLQLVEAVLILVGMTHLVACIWYGLGNADNQATTWLKLDDLERSSTAYRYATSVHWAVTQFTPASSEIMPTNTAERLFTVMVDFLGLVAFSTFVSTITQKMTMIRDIRSDEVEQREKLSHFLEQHDISLELTSRLTLFSRQRKVQMDNRLTENQIEVFHELPDILRRELHREMYTRRLSPHPWFAVMQRLDPGALEELYEAGISLRITFEDEDVFAYGEVAKYMYFVNYGSYTYIRLGERFKLEVADWVGEPGLWVDGWVHRGAFIASTHSEILCINNRTFDEKIVRKDSSVSVRRFIRGYVAAFVRLPVRNAPVKEISSEDGWDKRNSPKEPVTFSTRASRFSTSSKCSTKSMAFSRLQEVQHMIQLSDIWGATEDLGTFVQAGIEAAGIQRYLTFPFSLTPSV